MQTKERAILLKEVEAIVNAYKCGKLGGDFMPEDSNPGYNTTSRENFLFFTLPMALNYQRNSYKLWESAKATALDPETSDVFLPELVIKMEVELLREKLLKHKLALQPNKHISIWLTLCQTFSEYFDNDVRDLFKENHHSAKEIKEFILKNKKCFPYLSGNKIMNYWLYVMGKYCDSSLKDKDFITVAPDTHILQATLYLGMITEEEFNSSSAQLIAVERWADLLDGNQYSPIDVHTPLWLWSRSGFINLGD